MPVYISATSKRRPMNRPKPSADPSGMPTAVANTSAMPDTWRESSTISPSSDRVKIVRKISNIAGGRCSDGV